MNDEKRMVKIWSINRAAGLVLFVVVPCGIQLFVAFNPSGILLNGDDDAHSGNTTRTGSDVHSGDHTIDQLAVLQHFLTDTVASINVYDANSSTRDTAKRSTGTHGDGTNQTKIVAVCDSLYKEIAPLWYRRMTRLGYKNVVVVVVDDETADYLKEQGIPYESLADSAASCPKYQNIIETQKGKQQYRRTIFGMRYLYCLHELQRGNHILLTDIDNNFIRYLPMSVMEESSFDVYHAYGENHPTEIYSELGFTVCGGMAWFRSSPASIRFVKEILRQCNWKENSPTQCSVCDDQRKINILLLRAYGDSQEHNHNTTQWDIPPHALDQNVFWKQSISGHWGVTGHTFKLWDVDTAYRGPMPLTDDKCPGHKRGGQSQHNGTNNTTQHENWVAMPVAMNKRQKNYVEDRKLNFRQWYERCERDKLSDLEDAKLPIE